MPYPLSTRTIIGMVDHAILHPTLTDEQIRAELASIARYPVATVCIKPYAVKVAAEALRNSTIGVGTVIGFPHGSALPALKAAETERAFDDGAAEVDMVANIGKVLSEDWSYVREDIAVVLAVARQRRGLLKVIFETDYLTEDRHKIRLCEICGELGVDFVKTSTGFGFVKGPDGKFSTRGATEHDVALMRKHSPPQVGVKASGGIRTLDDAIRLIELGATRLGTSGTAALYEAAVERFGDGPSLD